mmetsp:Transcript_35570/g.141878  ORF Transcript_35570/g.141878 Transcript_35570/m.141878 type:complete len:97 (+) Transcript_35570:3440-3730(+)
MDCSRGISEAIGDIPASAILGLRRFPSVAEGLQTYLAVFVLLLDSFHADFEPVLVVERTVDVSLGCGADPSLSIRQSGLGRSEEKDSRRLFYARNT